MGKIIARYPRVDYPWDQWADGTVQKVKQGGGFLVKPHSFDILVRREAERRGMRVWVKVHPNAVVHFQFLKGDV